jgi:hypothetical protein
MRTKLVCIAVNVQPESTAESFLVANNNNQVPNAWVWRKSMALIGVGATNQVSWEYGWGGGKVYTDYSVSDTWLGLEGGDLARDITVDNINGDVIRNCFGVLDLTVTNVVVAASSHPDVIQTFGSSVPQNGYWRGVTAISSCNCQGLYGDSDTPLEDCAYIDWNINVDMSDHMFSAPSQHLIFRRITNAGSASWRDAPDKNFTADSILVEDYNHAGDVLDGTLGHRITFSIAGDVADAEITYNVT